MDGKHKKYDHVQVNVMPSKASGKTSSMILSRMSVGKQLNVIVNSACLSEKILKRATKKETARLFWTPSFVAQLHGELTAKGVQNFL